MERIVLGVFLACFVVQYAIETALLVVNLRHVRRSGGVPPPLAGRVDEDGAAKSRAYTLANGRFALVQGAFGAALTLVVLLSGLLPALDAALAARGVEGAHRFVLYLVLLATGGAAVSLPFSAWHTFVVEARTVAALTLPGGYVTRLFQLEPSARLVLTGPRWLPVVLGLELDWNSGNTSQHVGGIVLGLRF